MADYTEISNVSVEPLAPVTSELMTSLRDNPTAIAEGALGAPRLSVNASEGATAGGVLLWASLPETFTSSSSSPETHVVQTSVFRAVSTGTIRYKTIWVAQSGTGAMNTYKQTRGGVPTKIKSGSGTVDVSFAPGDVIYLRLEISGTGSGSITAYAEVFTSSDRINGGG